MTGEAEFQRLTDKFNGIKLCDMSSEQLQEFLGGIAKRASVDTLMTIGLNDEYAVSDIRDLRDLLRALRVMKKNAFTTIIGGFGRIIGWIIFLALTGIVLHSEAGKKLATLIGPS